MGLNSILPYGAAARVVGVAEMLPAYWSPLGWLGWEIEVPGGGRVDQVRGTDKRRDVRRCQHVPSHPDARTSNRPEAPFVSNSFCTLFDMPTVLLCQHGQGDVYEPEPRKSETS
ncbi:hypothetical protein Bbelb_114730 [Branchiostoma belcheri]|nr:hypothetical protein Bbelb_114730 [Branchiostoma belcheri]